MFLYLLIIFYILLCPAVVLRHGKTLSSRNDPILFCSLHWRNLSLYNKITTTHFKQIRFWWKYVIKFRGKVYSNFFKFVQQLFFLSVLLLLCLTKIATDDAQTESPKNDQRDPFSQEPTKWYCVCQLECEHSIIYVTYTLTWIWTSLISPQWQIKTCKITTINIHLFHRMIHWEDDVISEAFRWSVVSTDLMCYSSLIC